MITRATLTIGNLLATLGFAIGGRQRRESLRVLRKFVTERR